MIVGKIYKYSEENIVKYFSYIGDSDDASQVIGIEIGSSNPNRDSILIDGLKMVAFADHPIFVKSNTISGPLFIKGTDIEISKDLFNEILNKLISSIIDDYKNDVSDCISRNYSPSKKELTNIVIPEKIIRLLLWNKKKTELKFDTLQPQMPSCMKYGLYFAYLGTNIGSEIDKSRPVLIWKKHESNLNSSDNSYFVFPVSSKIPKKDYNYNVQIAVNGKTNIIKINDGRRISGLRIVKPLKDKNTGKMYMLSKSDIELVKNSIKNYFNIK